MSTYSVPGTVPRPGAALVTKTNKIFVLIGKTDKNTRKHLMNKNIVDDFRWYEDTTKV